MQSFRYLIPAPSEGRGRGPARAAAAAPAPPDRTPATDGMGEAIWSFLELFRGRLEIGPFSVLAKLGWPTGTCIIFGANISNKYNLG